RRGGARAGTRRRDARLDREASGRPGAGARRGPSPAGRPGEGDGRPMSVLLTPEGERTVERLVTFGRILREAGLEVGPGRLQDALRGLDQVDLASRQEVYHALRCTLVSRREDIDAFDAAFAAFWEQAPRPGPDQPVDFGFEA